MTTFHVDPIAGPYTTIQAAVDAAKAAGGGNHVVEIVAGTYKEQVVVDGQTGLKLVGIGDVNIVGNDDAMQTATSSSNREVHAVVTVTGSTDVVLNNIDVDGRGLGDTVSGPVNPNFVGVFYRNSSGKLENVDIAGIHDTYPGGSTSDGFPVQSGVQRGVGLQVDNDVNLAFTMIGGSIQDFQKNATVFNHAILDVSGVTIIGGGAQTVMGQNGFQATNSTGSIRNNIVRDLGYAGTTGVTATGILVYGNTNLDIKDNIVTGSSINGAEIAGIYITDFGTPNSGGEVSGNIISSVDTGIVVTGNFTGQGAFVHDNTVTGLDPTNPDAVGVDLSPTSTTAPFIVEGTEGDDSLIGSNGDDTLSGLGGDDVVDGGGGNDTIDGGLGADTFDLSAAGANGGFVDLATGIAFSAATGIDGLTNVENVTGSVGADSINGDGNANVLKGGDGNDILTGRGGNDTIDGGVGFDKATFSGSASNYTFAAGAGNSVVVTGPDGQDTLTNVEVLSFGSGPDVWIVKNSAELTYALANVGEDGKIKLADGTYSGNFVINKDGVTLESLSGDETAVVLKGSFKTDNSISSGTVADYLKTATGYSGTAGAGISVQADDVSIKGITIREYRTGVDLRSNSGLTIDNVVFDENIHGVYKETGSAVVTGFTLINSHFEDGYQGVIINAGTSAATSGSFSGIMIDAVSFAHMLEKGMYFEQLSDAEFSNLVMNDVGTFGRGPAFGGVGQNGAGIDINLKYLAYSDIYIHDFIFTNVGLSTGTTGISHINGGAIHIKARDDNSYAANPATLDGVIVEDGSITGTSTGIRFGEPNATTGGPTDVIITNVGITGATVGAFDNQTTAMRTVVLGSGADIVTVNPNSKGPFSFDGGGGDDTITGGIKDDEFTGGSGNDEITGGTNGAFGDTAIFEKTFGSYVVTESGNSYLVTDRVTGHVDNVSGVENFKFSDQTFSHVDIDDTALLTPGTPPTPPAPPTPTNTAPTISAANADTTVEAGEAISLTIGDGHFTDAQGTDLTYSISVNGSAAPSWVTFNTATGAFTAAPATTDVGQYTIVVTASDGSLTSSPDDFVLVVTNPAVEPGGEVTLSGNTVAENSAKGTVVGALSGVDADGDAFVSYALGSNPGGAFKIVDGQLVVAKGADLDFEAKATYDITVTATDNDGGAFEENFTISLTDVAEDPKGDGGKNNLEGDAQDNILDGKGGKDKLTGGDGADTFVFGKGYGKDTITDFDPTEGDKIDLSDAKGIKDFNDLIANHIDDSGKHLKITTGDGSVLVIKHFDDASLLTEDMFIF
jgi:Ca2+-binding RTX toxin-like protein